MSLSREDYFPKKIRKKLSALEKNKKLYTHNGYVFSKNGSKAFRNGEKPKFMWSPFDRLIPTITHHIRINGKPKLFMFYKKVPL